MIDKKKKHRIVNCNTEISFLQMNYINFFNMRIKFILLLTRISAGDKIRHLRERDLKYRLP